MHLRPFQQRRLTAELMDAPDLNPTAHHRALAGLARINRISGTARALARPILALARRHALTHLTLLDVACGGGDVPLALAGILQHRGITPALTLVDCSPTALATARAHAGNIPVTCLLGQAPDALPPGPFDVVINSLFLHHLSTMAATQTLAALYSRAARLLLVSDLRRSSLGWALAWAGCRLLSRSPIVHFDGPTSVAAAYSQAELADMAAHAGISHATIGRSFPFRMLLTAPRR